MFLRRQGDREFREFKEFMSTNILIMKHIVFSFLLTGLALCSCSQKAQESKMTAEMALEGVSNYCHSAYDWSIAEDNPSIMSVTMGEESDSAYQVVFRSYTGALVYFYVSKTDGTTRMVEYEPTLNAESEAGTIDLHDYLKGK